MSTRPSVYLIQKCETLENALHFFLDKNTGYCRSLAEKRAVFLSQMNFWEWEIDNLIYSFESFKERSEAWDSVDVMSQNLERLSIKLKDNILSDLWDKRYTRTRKIRPTEDGYVKHEDVKTIAPLEKLGLVIDTWNKLIDVCEDVMVKNFPPEYQCAYLPDLKKYKKKMP